MKGSSVTVNRAAPKSAAGLVLFCEGAPLEQHTKSGCLTTIAAIASLRFSMRILSFSYTAYSYRKDSFLTTEEAIHEFFLLDSSLALRTAGIQFSAAASLSFLSFSLNRLYFLWSHGSLVTLDFEKDMELTVLPHISVKFNACGGKFPNSHKISTDSVCTSAPFLMSDQVTLLFWPTLMRKFS